MSFPSPASSYSTPELDDALARASRRALQFEVQIKDLESKLSTSLSNSRALSDLLSASSASLAASARRADRALAQHVPYTLTALDTVFDTLAHLKEELPHVREQVAQVHRCYSGGKIRAQDLISSLEFLNMPFPTRILTIILGPSPASARRTLMLRIVFGLTMMLMAWAVLISVGGIMRAHRKGVLWGERLMS